MLEDYILKLRYFNKGIAISVSDEKLTREEYNEIVEATYKALEKLRKNIKKERGNKEMETEKRDSNEYAKHEFSAELNNDTLEMLRKEKNIKKENK